MLILSTSVPEARPEYSLSEVASALRQTRVLTFINIGDNTFIHIYCLLQTSEIGLRVARRALSGVKAWLMVPLSMCVL